MKSQLKKLWIQAFDSTTSYTNLFFDYLYSEENIRFEKRDGKIVSAAYTLPYNMRFCGQNLPASYMCGVATDEKFRGQGIVSKLMERSFRELYSENTVFCGLIPMSDSLFHFYKRFGFSSVYQCVKTEFSKTGKSMLKLSPLTEYDLCSKIYNEKIAVHDLSYLMPPEHFDFLSHESRMFKENPIAIYKDGIFSGYLFYTKASGINLIREIVTDDVSVPDAVNALCRDYKIDSVTVYTPSFYGFEGEKFSLGMLRIINVKTVLEAFYKKQEKPITFFITDDIIPENNGYFTVREGKVTSDESEKPDYRFTVTELLPFLYREISPFEPYINMLLN